MPGVNYSKWDHLDDDDDYDDDDDGYMKNVSTEASMSESIIQIEVGNRQASELFDVAETSRDKYDYTVALHSYNQVIDKIVQEQKFASYSRLLQLLIACHLNKIACYARLLDWDNVLFYGSAAMNEFKETLTEEQHIRILYFLSHANYSINTKDSVALSKSQIDDMSRLLSNQPIKGDEYRSHFETVNNRYIDRLTRNDSASELVYSIESSKSTWILLNKSRYNDNKDADDCTDILAYSKIFKSCVSTVEKSRDSVTSSMRYDVSQVYLGYAACLQTMGDLVAAAESIVSAAEYSVGIAKNSLLLRAATNYYKCNDYDNAIKCYMDAAEPVTVDDGDGSGGGAIVIDMDTLDDYDLIAAIAKNGVGSCYIKQSNYVDCIKYASQSAAYYSRHIIQMQCGTDKTSTVLSTLKYTLTAHELLIAAYVAVADYESAMSCAIAAAEICNSIINRMTAVQIDPCVLNGVIKGKASVLLSQVRIIQKQHQSNKSQKEKGEGNDRSITEGMTPILEQVASCYRQCSSHYELYTIYKHLAIIWAELSGAKPFLMEKSSTAVKKEHAATACEYWTAASSAMLKVLNKSDYDCSSSSSSSSSGVDHKYDYAMSLFDSAVCAIYYDHALSKRLLESSQEYIKDLSKTYTPIGSSGITETLMGKMDANKESVLVTLAGDVSYHLAYLYMLQGTFDSSKDEISYAIAKYHSSSSEGAGTTGSCNDRLKLAFGLSSLIYAKCGEYSKAYEQVQLLRQTAVPGPVRESDSDSDSDSVEYKKLMDVIDGIKHSHIRQSTKVTAAVRRAAADDPKANNIRQCFEYLKRSYARIDVNLYVSYAIVVAFVSIVLYTLSI